MTRDMPSTMSRDRTPPPTPPFRDTFSPTSSNLTLIRGAPAVGRVTQEPTQSLL